MAGFAARAGHAVGGYDPDPARRDALAAAGGTPQTSVAAAVRAAEVVFTSLPDDRILRETTLGAVALLDALAPGAVYVDTSTVSAGLSEEIARAAAARGIDYLRMPVSGNANSAKAGQITALVSGPRVAWDRVRPVVETFSTAQVYLGAAEEARYMKLVVNLVVANSAQVLAEALTLGRAGGLDWSTMLDALAASTVGSPWIKAKADRLKVHDYAPTFTTPQIQKDMDLILEAARAKGVPLPLTGLTRGLTDAVVAAGLGEEDFIALVKLAERRAGLAPLRMPE